MRPKRNIKTAMNHEIMLYGIAQKEQMGFDKAVEECSATTCSSNHAHTRARAHTHTDSVRLHCSQSTE